ncbi:Pls/PosA family non-ribosomal peptide synthetase [Corynebacterium sp. H130]|uniref:Pls/PosA family non-ribosomal peptide synthetase n=1 Tax=Corynebacterium sp. H130 TaxID=3133444 RepID=UPI0030951447
MQTDSTGVLTPEEEAQRLKGIDHPELAIYGVGTVPDERTLVDIVEKTMASHPDAVAIEGANGTLTYAELRAAVAKQHEVLASHGIGLGDRIGIRVPSGTTDLYVAILATICAGAAYVPVDWDDPDERANTVWEEADVVAVYGADLSLTTLRERDERATPARPTLDHDAWIIFTSGSTGKPKGVAITHRSAAALVDVEADFYLSQEHLRPGDRVMAGLSVAFDASCEEMWLAWRSGATLVAAPRDIVRSGEDLGRWIIAENITAVSTVPTLASLWPVEALDKVRLLIFGGEACPIELIEKYELPGREVWNTYGPTEATVIATAELLTTEPPVRIGRPIEGWELVVVDTEGNPVKWGETGELIIGGVGLGRYLDAAKDAEKYAPLPSMGWERAYRTGDLVRAEQKGLVFAGRIDDQIKIGGKRMELGEVDAHLTAMPGIRTGAAAVHKTKAGTSVLVGYLAPEEGATIDLDEIRPLLAKRLPGGVVPSLCVMDQLPMKTSGKVDRKLLPWPLPSTGDEKEDVPEHMQWLADLWLDQLGPVPLNPASNFFELGGGSVAIARLVTALREQYPGADIAALYAHPTLQEMYDYATSLGAAGNKRREPEPIPASAGWIQALTVAALYGYNAARYMVGILAVVAALYYFFSAGWVPRVPVLPILLGWLLLFSTPGRMLIATVSIRLLNRNLKPGEYLRGGGVHMRVWAAQRILEHLKFDKIYGSPMANTLHRALGAKVGNDCTLHHAPSVTGLLTISNRVSVEAEADLNGYWLDGDRFILGEVTLDQGSRVGERCIAMPGAHVREGAEIVPGSRITGTIPANETWGGSPIVRMGAADEAWPEQRPEDIDQVHVWSPMRNFFGYQAAVLWLTVMPVLALIPGGMLVLGPVIHNQWYDQVFPIFALWLPVFVLLTIATWLSLVILTVRIASVFVRPGYFASHSSVGLSLWIIHTCLQRTLVSTYFIYASFFTPTFMRMMGAKVGRNVEISTIETIPHLTVFRDGSFMADHALISSTRHKNGWVHVGSSVIGEKSFVGNSAIIGPDRDLPDDSLVAVLSSVPTKPAIGTSWLGRSSEPIPRAKVEADAAATYQPPMHLQIARVCVELCRLIPAIIAGYIDLAIVWALTWIYIEGGMGVEGLITAAIASYPVVFAAGLFATLLPVALKWILIGRFKAVNKPLFCSFVWRGELFDVFSESLAVPSFIRMCLGSPMFNAWARLMGVKIGKNVWCETWWLPEFDLITLEDGVSINRGTVLQTHLFHDRVMSMEKVTFKAGSTLGPNSFVLPGATVNERTTVFPGSLVMRQETLPADTVWSGNPVRHIAEVTDTDNSMAFADMIAQPNSNAPATDAVSVLNLTPEGARWDKANS